MFTDEEFIVVSPHTVSALVAICMSLAEAGVGRLLVTLMIRWSPGLMWSVGPSLPSGVVKQKSVRPCASCAVLYARLTVSVPSWLKRAGGFVTVLPGANLGHGLCAAAAIGVSKSAKVMNKLMRSCFKQSSKVRVAPDFRSHATILDRCILPSVILTIP